MTSSSRRHINPSPESLPDALLHSVGILQPATFYRRSLLERVGPLSTDFNCAFDYELWLRFIGNGSKAYFLDEDLVVATFHDAAKSTKLRSRQLHEFPNVTYRHFGFASAEWVARAADCDLTKKNGIIDSATNALPPRALLDGIVSSRFRRANSSKSARTALLNAPKTIDYSKSLALASKSGLLDLSRVIVTTFDEHYKDQGLTFIASVHRHQPDAQVVLVYDLNLSSRTIDELEKLHNVFVVPFRARTSWRMKTFSVRRITATSARRSGTRDGTWPRADPYFGLTLEFPCFGASTDLCARREGWCVFHRSR